MTLTIEVPDGSPKADEISAWKDGGDYNLSVVQTGPGKFKISDPEGETPDETVSEDGEEPGTMAEMANKFNEKE